MSLDCLSGSLQVFGPMQILIGSHFVGLVPWAVCGKWTVLHGMFVVLVPDMHYVILRARLCF